MNTFILKCFIFCLFICVFDPIHSQTLIMNEVSNGPSGSKEYVEFVVVSNSVTYSCNSLTPPSIDIRGWIFDDNSGYHGSSGVASGAVRFSQNPLWQNIPLGTIILLYNDADVNPDIPADDLSLSDGNFRRPHVAHGPDEKSFLNVRAPPPRHATSRVGCKPNTKA